MKLDRITELENAIVQLKRQQANEIHRLEIKYLTRIEKLEKENHELQAENDKMDKQLQELGLR